MTNYRYITKTDELADLDAVLGGGEVRLVGIDIETLRNDPNDEFGAFHPHRGRIRLIQIAFEGGKVPTMVIDAERLGVENLGSVVDLISNPKILKVAHNAKFEIKWFLHHLAASDPAAFFDTMLAGKLISGGEKSHRHSLRDVALAYTGTALDKEEQTSDWSVPELTESQLRYAALDAEIVLDIYREQVSRMMADDLLRVGTIEFDAIKPIARMELNGMHLDRERWTELLDRKKAELEVLRLEMLELLQCGVDWTEPNPEKRGKRPVKPKKPKHPLRVKGGRELKNRLIAEGRFDSEKLRIDREYERDIADWKDEIEAWQVEFDRWDALPDEIPATLNPNSVDQIKKVLFNVAGIELKSTNNKFLKLHAGHPAIDKLLEYRGLAKSVSAFGDNILDAIDPDGRIRPDVNQMGADATGRMSMKSPNLQQIPHAEEYRRCFTAPAGRKLITSDYSQIELRILAEFSRDKVFLGDFNSGLDLHIKGASRFMRVPYDAVSKTQRNHSKRTNFGVVYGIGDRALAGQLNIEQWEAASLIESYFRVYRGNKRYLDIANYGAVTHLFARTMTGRIARFHHDGSNKWVEYAIGRNGMNMPIQGTAADMMKRAIYLIDEALRGTSGKLVNIVHDEVVVEADEWEAEKVAGLVEDAMVSAGREFIMCVPVIAEAVIADEWSK